MTDARDASTLALVSETGIHLSSARVQTTRRSQRTPWKWLHLLLPLAIAISGPLFLTGPYGWIVTGCSAVMGIAAALARFMGRGDVVSTMTEAKQGALELTPAELVVRAGDRSEQFDRAEVASGWIETEHASDYLVLQMKSGTVVRAALSREEGERALAELGMARDPRAMTLRLGSPQPRHLGGKGQRAAESMVLGCAGLFTGAFALLGLVGVVIGSISAVFGSAKGDASSSDIGGMLGSGLILLLFGVATTYLFGRIRQRLPPVPTIAHIGAEGVELVRRGRRRWIPFTALESVTCEGGNVHFRLTKSVEVVKTAGAAEAQAVVERVRAAEAWATRGSTAHRIEQLDRAGRTLDAWRNALEALSAKGAAGYREVAISAEVLAQVVEDGTAAAERRLGAAFALASFTGDEAVRKRVRIAAEASANERLRIALVKASDGELEEEAVEEALEESRARARDAS